MLTTLGFNKTAGTISASYEAIPGVLDQSMPFGSNSQFLPPIDLRVRAALVRYLHATQARLNSPFLRSMLLPELYPVNVSATIANNPSFMYFDDYGPLLRRGEGFSLEVSSDATAATRVQGALFVEDRHVPAVAGTMYTLAADVTVTTVAGVWTNAIMTFRQALSAGTYEIVGMAVTGTEATAARLVMIGNGWYRPGCIPFASYGNTMAPQLFRAGRMGTYGRFVQTAQPSIEFLGFAGAAETPVVYLDIVKISDNMNVPSMMAA